MAKEPKNANVTYFKVDSDGYIYLTSKTNQEGYKEYFDRDGKHLGYKKIFSATDDGFISDLRIHTAEFDTGKVEYVSVSIKNEDRIENVQFQLTTQKGGLSNYAKAIAQVLPNVDYSKRFSISFDKRKDDGGYTVKNIYFNQSDEEGTPAVPIYHRYKNKKGDNGGDIPNMEQAEGLGGKVIWDTSKQDNYLYKSLMAQIERFKEFLNGEKSTSKEENSKPSVEKSSPKNTKKVEVEVEDEDEELPF